MAEGSEKELLRLAFEDSLARLRRDRALTSGMLRKFLDHLEPRLFDPDLNVSQWKRASGVRSNSIEDQFRKAFGSTPFAYLIRNRMETAARLLSRTDLTIGRVGVLIGMPDLSVFSRAFEHWAKIRPRKYRLYFQRSRETVVSPHSERVYFCRLNRQALVAAASLEKLTELDRMTELYPPLRPSPDLPTRTTARRKPVAVEREVLERWRAKRVWTTLRDRSVEYQRDQVRSQASFETTALFDLLRHKSREEGRKDRQRGVALAELALASLEVCGREADLNLRVLGRAWLANARRLALDYPGAEREFALAEADWRFVGDARDQRVEAELLNGKAALCFYQRRLPEALQAANDASAINRRLNRRVELARTLILRAAIRQHEGNAGSAIPDFEEALTLLQGCHDDYLRASAFSNLAVNHIELGDYAAAKQATHQAQQLSQQIEYPLGQYQIAWLAGRVEEAQGHLSQAEALFRNARDGMIALGEHGYAAVISLDLAIIYAGVGRGLDVLTLVPPAISILEICQVRREVLAALDLLRQAVEQKAFDVKLLRMIRALITELLDNPAMLPDPRSLKGRLIKGEKG